MKTYYVHVHVVPTFESVEEILWHDHSNETSLAVHSYGTTVFVFQYFTKLKLELFFLNSGFWNSWESKGEKSPLGHHRNNCDFIPLWFYKHKI